MADAKKCDLCGGFYEPMIYPRKLSVVEYDHKTYDLCKECYKKLEALIKTNEDTESKNADEIPEIDIPIIPEKLGYSNHDCCTIYKCPKCGEKFDDYQSGAIGDRCPYCKQKLKY